MSGELTSKAVKVLAPLSIVGLVSVIAGGSAWVSPFWWHPVLMTFGYLVLMSHGVLTATQAVTLPAGEQRLQLLKKHMLVQVVANLSVIGGLVAIYQNKELHSKQHFSTPHAKFGLFTMGLSFYSPLLGVLGFRFLGLTQYLPNEAFVSRVKASHRVVGHLTIVVGIATATYGVYLHMSGVTAYVSALCMLVSMAVHIYFAVVKNPIQMLP